MTLVCVKLILQRKGIFCDPCRNLKNSNQFISLACFNLNPTQRNAVTSLFMRHLSTIKIIIIILRDEKLEQLLTTLMSTVRKIIPPETWMKMPPHSIRSVSKDNPLEGMVKRKSFCLPYYTPKDERFKVLSVCTVGITLEYPFCIVSGWRKTFSDTLMNGRKKCQRDRDTRMLRKRECALVKRHWKASGSLVTQ